MRLDAARPRKSVLIGQPQSLSLEASLQRALQPMIRQVRRSLVQVDSPAAAKALGVALRREWSDAKIRRLLEQTGTRAERYSSRGWERLTAAADARRRRGRDGMYIVDARPRKYDGEKLVERWSKIAADLITSVRDEVAEGLRRDVVEAVAKGAPVEVLIERWRSRGVPVLWGTMEGRIKVIAQHQLASLHAEVQRTRAESVGVTEFYWRSMEDDRVRPLHQNLNGKTFKYADPETDGEGLPGTPINCRCWAESIVSAELIGELGLQGLIAA